MVPFSFHSCHYTAGSALNLSSPYSADEKNNA